MSDAARIRKNSKGAHKRLDVTDWRDYGYPTPGTEYELRADGWHRKPFDADDPQTNEPIGRPS